MDLLGDYDSNNENDSESSDDNKNLSLYKEINTNESTLLSKSTQRTASTTTTATSKAEKRGRKILSLNAVLPSNIFNQLVLRQGNEFNKGSDDSSSSSLGDDDDDDDYKQARKKARKRFRSNDNEKDGLQSLLHDLHSIPDVSGSRGYKNDAKYESKSGSIICNDKEDHNNDVEIEDKTTAIRATPNIRNTAFSSIPRPSSSHMYQNTAPRLIAPSQSIPPPEPPQHQIQQKPLSQKQIIQALRKGTIPSSIPTLQLPETKTNPSDIQLQESQHASSTIPNPQLELYNPSEGKMVSSHDISHKRKNQIHHLLKQAHVLETTKPLAGSGGNSNRVGAKKKYGW